MAFHTTARAGILALAASVPTCSRSCVHKPLPAPKAALPSVAVAQSDVHIAGCTRNDSTGRPLLQAPEPALPLPIGPTVADLDSLNELCGDTWCEGSFEFFFHAWQCDARTSACYLDMRLYTHLPVTPPARVVGLTRSGPGFRGTVIAQSEHPRCTPPCWSSGAIDPPCGIFDVRCDIQFAPSALKVHAPDAADEITVCIDAMEDGIRKRVPEFAPRRR